MSLPDELRRRIEANLDRLPPMPHTVAEVMAMGSGDDASVGGLAQVVCRDPTLAARVLKLCNSGAYSLSSEVTSIQRAVVLLGFEMTRNLVFSTFVRTAVQGDLAGYGQTSEALWQHSFGVASAALCLAESAAKDLAEVAYTAGLIHDIGKVVLASLVADRFDEVLERVAGGGGPFHRAERRVLGADHAAVGGWVAERWGLAPSLVEVIRTHHDPVGVSPEPRLGALVRVADGLCGMLGIGLGLDGVDSELDPASLAVLVLEGDALQGALDRATARVFDLDHGAGD